MRIGQGFDVHKFAEGRKLILAGHDIPYPLGLEGHSDADVVIHAVIDALLGAAGLGDIGIHFPDTDPAFHGASSMTMLEIIINAVEALGFRIGNIDITVFAEKPRIGPYRAAMLGNLATVMKVDPERLNIKATTTEGLGFVGRGEGIAASAVALLEEGQID
ncbi:MAG TPA: 2-C-methyl-D-erythritol 2,4-cyclodiphosphate synthase [Desulfomonilaceae bacterium]|nr:2-C-methyl-D-erythritol 2,4-cyclodiphosphate synthase [Desulfomonilaceae bacterium]